MFRSPMTIRQQRTAVRAWLYVLFVMALASVTSAETPLPELRGYHHTAWTADNGVGSVREIYQSSDGYLWLTASRGIFRFDGVRFLSVDDATGGAVHDRDVDAVFPSKFGGMWFTTKRQGLILWKDNKTFVFPDRRCTQGRKPNGMAEDSDGSLWIDASSGLFHLHQGICDRIGPETGYPGSFAQAVFADSSGTVWVKVPAGELYFRRRGETRFSKSPLGSKHFEDTAAIHEAPDHSVWLADREGLRKVANAGGVIVLNASLKPLTGAIEFEEFVFAQDGSLWAATDHGVAHFHDVLRQPAGVSLQPSQGEFLSSKNGLSSNDIWAVTVDREGCIWLATNSGMDRLRPNLFASLKIDYDRSLQVAIAPGTANDVWYGSYRTPLTHLDEAGHATAFSDTRQVRAIRRGLDGLLWSGGYGKASLWRVDGKTAVAVHYPNDKTEVPASLAVDRHHDLWVSTFGPNMLHYQHGAWINENANLGRKPGVLGAMTNDADGNVWIAFSNKLLMWDGEKYYRYSFPDGGTLNISVFTLAARNGHVWMGGGGGLAIFHDGRFERVNFRDSHLPGSVTGIVETANGDLWLNGFSGAIRIAASELQHRFTDPDYLVVGEAHDTTDGLPGLAGERYPEPSLVESSSGRLWFATVNGIAWLDPSLVNQSKNHLLPPVVIESITANGQTYSTASQIKLPPHTDNVQIDYTALSLSVPERVQFRYKLDGIDDNWQEPGTRRLAFYAHLPPGHYQFHVIATNNDGLWNELGATFAFDIKAAWYQTAIFRILSISALIAMILGALRIRMNHLRQQMHARHEERLAERERIARELHDTLLQGLQGVMLRFYANADQLSSHDPAKVDLLETLQLADTVMQDGRERVRDLRTHQANPSGLVAALSTIGDQLQSIRRVRFTARVEGTERLLKRLTHEELLLVGREALTNAFMHAGATSIEVEIAYQPKWLVLSVRDDGCGINQDVLAAGEKEGHWGLPGMRERAEKLGADLRVFSQPGEGTCVALRVPAALAYLPTSTRVSVFSFGRERRKGKKDRRDQSTA